MPPLSGQSSFLLSLAIFLCLALITAIINKLVNKANNFNDLFLSKMPIPSLLFYFMSVLILFLALLYFSEKNRTVPVLNAHTQDTPALQEQSNNNQNVWKRLVDNRSEWDSTEMDRLSEDVYCPHIYNNNFVYRTLWYLPYVPAAFNKIQLRFVVTKPDNNYIPSKALIQFGDVYGKDYNVANIYIPFDKTRVINFESYDSKNNNLVFQDNAGSLPLPVKSGSTVTVTISTTNVLDNTITYQYHFDYIPDGETDSIPKDLQFLVKFPDSSPRQLLIKFGLGVFANSCLKNIEYAI